MTLTNPMQLLAASAGHPSAWWAPIFWMALVFIIVMVLLRVGLRGAKQNVPRGFLARAVEHVFHFIEDMCVGVIGPHGKKYVPLITTIYLLILFSNLIGLVGLGAPTASLGFTLGLALVVVFYVQYEGIRVNGPLGYIKHFFGPNLGMKWYTVLPIFIALLMFFIEVVSEVAKNLSLSLRLQGNISGEHMVGGTFGSMWSLTDTFYWPVQTPLVLLGVFVCLVQALVFTMLSCVYLSLFTAHASDEAHAH